MLGLVVYNRHLTLLNQTTPEPINLTETTMATSQIKETDFDMTSFLEIEP